MTSSYWFQSSDTPTPTPGVIGQSLRFRGTQSLTRDFTVNGQSAWTWSGWLKKSEPDGSVDQIIFHTDSPLQFSLSRGDSFGYTQSSVASFEDAKRRDPSAWYHRVDTYDGTDMKMYINGVLQQTWTIGSVGWNTATTHDIGYDSARPTEGWMGCMADIHFIDGQCLNPNSFGEFDNNNVWVPANTNFSVGQSKYSDFLTAEGGFMTDTATGGGATYAFNGNLEQRATTNNGNALVTFAPVSAIAFTDGVEAMVRSNSNITLNGGANIAANAGESEVWTELATGAGSINTITAQATNGSATAVYGFRINPGTATEQILTNPFLWSTNLTAATGFQPNLPPADAFDGDTSSTQAGTNGTGASLVFSPSTDIPVTELAIYTGMLAGGTLEWNGNNVSTLQNTWTIITDTGVLSAANPMTLTSDPSSTCTLYAIRINGQILIDGVNGSYGANGFHLEFEDSNDLGKDSSGNGNNWTAIGFDTVTPANWSAQCYNGNITTTSPTQAQIDAAVASTDQTNISPQGPNGGFDGTINYALLANPGCLVFRPNTPIENVTRIICEQYAGQRNVLNGVDLGNTSASASTELIYDGAPVTLENFAAYSVSGSGGNGGWYRLTLTINGVDTVLINSNGTDYDLLLDSPTQNYATGNPIDALPGSPSSFNWSKANLYGTGISNGQYFGTASQQWDVSDTNTYYWEVSCESVPSGSYPTVTIFQPWGSAWNRNVFLWSFDNGTARFQDDSGTEVVNQSWQSLSQGDVAGIWFDGSTNTIYGQVNGGTINSFVIPNRDRPMRPGFMCPPQNSAVINANFGQQPFLYSPPAGFSELQTQNLPAATIANGRDHFQAITGPGTGAGTGGRQGNWINDLFSAPPGDRDQAHASTVDVFQSGAPKTLAFDGNIGTVAETDQSQGRPGWMSFRPSDTTVSGLTASSTFKIKVRRIQELWVNGTQMTGDFTSNSGSLFDLSSQLTFPFTLESLEIGAISGQDAGLFGIELDGELLTQNGILETAQTTFPNGLWWIKDRANSNQHQLVDSVRGGNLALNCPTVGAETAYIAPSGNSVAWCWNAGGAAVANSDGAIPTQVAANTDAGFSIITFTGTPSAGSLGHGLGKEVEFVITKSRDANRVFQVYHKYLGVNQWLLLNSNQGTESPVNNFWGEAANWNATTCGCNTGTDANHNFDGDDMIWYAWHSVPGYSSFGTYMGNSDPDGPFVWLGFKPAFILIKRIDTSDSWHVYDTTRSTYNSSNMVSLKPDKADGEDGTFNQIDILSNGFKCRSSNSATNTANSIVYAAFAENPFNYPVGAR